MSEYNWPGHAPLNNQGWEFHPEFNAPPGMMWASPPAGSWEAGFAASDSAGNTFTGGSGGSYGPSVPCYSGGWYGAGWSGWPGGWYQGPFGHGFGGTPYGGGGSGSGGFAMDGQTGPGIYNDARMNYSGGPPRDDGMPGVNMKNSIGGIGAEPGYDYIFPPEHTKVHVLYSKHPPWHNDGQYRINCFHVPTNITCKELLQQFGCKNKDAGKNAMVECARSGNGKWYKGLVMQGNADIMKQTLKDIGWNQDRDGVKNDFVWLWFTSDYNPSE